MELYILESNIYLDMPSKKEVTIGITINLDNYENIRLEVEGDAETREDVPDSAEEIPRPQSVWMRTGGGFSRQDRRHRKVQPGRRSPPNTRNPKSVKSS